MEPSIQQQLYTCSSCCEVIPKLRARIACDDCLNFNLCTNCHIIEYFTTPHLKSHSTIVFRESGYITASNPHFGLLPISDTDERARKVSEIPTANWGALWSVMKAPLVKKTPKSSDTTSDNLSKPDAGSPLSQSSTSPSSSPLTSRKECSSIDCSKPMYIRPDKWEPFFEANSTTPRPIFVALMSTIFNLLDDRETGYLKPEVYSNFLEMQGYPLPANKWKMAREKAAGVSSKDVADLELELFFSQRNISHILAARPAELEQNGRKIQDKPLEVAPRARTSTDVSLNMPLLLRQGFIDICAHDYLQDPMIAHQYLMNVVQELGVWKELGDLPRSVFPSLEIPSFQITREAEKTEGMARETPKLFIPAPKTLDMTNNSAPLSFIGRPRPVSLMNFGPSKSRMDARKRLILQTNLPDDSLSFDSPMSARSPYRRKVETLIEAYERVRSDTAVSSPVNVMKPFPSPRATTFLKDPLSPIRVSV
ncbi:Bgt-4226 [Blumeria graminis f. sp. tritici]|uniref:Bgt-4226 n=2 Tax=Blumeria graminis f. sp. tritici TaxID=62690 RepID=A0A061HKE1_BLUGR|nr:hypothetical protein BGT96224_4226 [Blumeria graminis f. sp. tritici 96224]VDB93627.1 Bgt-4226 [Blumeria graminis f. sp. tritici]